ncbi:MAG: helix-turn-helix domain-containing protein, partial [Bacteroidales bacterium]|nr:helix-turn-helix domain-containing protein [Bacteroidales bacterium]
VPPLRERKDDIYLLFRRFAIEQAERYKMPTITLTNEARHYLMNYFWQGNIRQLKNITDQISIIETNKEISLETLKTYIPPINSLPMVIESNSFGEDYSQRELILTILSNKQQISKIQNELDELKSIIKTLIGNQETNPYLISSSNNKIILTNSKDEIVKDEDEDLIIENEYDEVDEKPLTLVDLEKKAIIAALKRADGKRSKAASELGISERTLYRKINEFNIKL